MDPGRSRPEDELLPAPRLVGYGLQHILAMFGGVIAVPIIVATAAGLDASDTALLLAAALFVSGAATVLQTLGVGRGGRPWLGSQLPLVQGTTFASVATILSVLATTPGPEGLRVVFGAALVAGVIGLLLTPFFAQVIRFFPPVVTGSIITVMGLSLMPVAAGWITGQPELDGRPNPNYLDMGNTALAFATLALVLVAARVRALARMAILLGLVLGTLVALAVGSAQTGGLAGEALLALPDPLHFGAPVFAVGAIVSMTIVILVTMVETTADILAVSDIVETETDTPRVAAGLRADMLSCTVAPLLNSFPATAFAQNVGLVALTGVKSRYVVATGGAILMLLGLSPLLAAAIGVIPLPVLGGAAIALFGTVAASGIRTLAQVSYRDNQNLLIVAVAVGFGLLPVVSPQFWSAFPDWWVTIFASGISSAAVMAVALHVAFNVVAGRQGAGDSGTVDVADVSSAAKKRQGG